MKIGCDDDYAEEREGEGVEGEGRGGGSENKIKTNSFFYRGNSGKKK